MSKPIKQASGSWKQEIMLNGERSSKTFKTKGECVTWAANQVVRSAPGKPTLNRTLDQLAEKYIKEVSSKKAGEEKEVIRINYYRREFPDLFAMSLSKIQLEDIEALVDVRLEEVMTSTINRDLNIFSNMFAKARKWKMMMRNVMEGIERPKDPEGRTRRVSDEEAALVCAALHHHRDQPVVLAMQKTAVAFLLAIETAMRMGEICKTEWKNVHLDKRYVHLPAAIVKTRVSRDVPLSAEAIRLIKQLPCEGELMMGLSARTCSTQSAKAIKEAGIDDMTFHDTRHEATTRLAQKLHVLDLARVTGHRDIKMLMRYYNKSAIELADLL
jgi:integrase